MKQCKPELLRKRRSGSVRGRWSGTGELEKEVVIMEEVMEGLEGREREEKKRA